MKFFNSRSKIDVFIKNLVSNFSIHVQKHHFFKYSTKKWFEFFHARFFVKNTIFERKMKNFILL